MSPCKRLPSPVPLPATRPLPPGTSCRLWKPNTGRADSRPPSCTNHDERALTVQRDLLPLRHSAREPLQLQDLLPVRHSAREPLQPQDFLPVRYQGRQAIRGIQRDTGAAERQLAAGSSPGEPQRAGPRSTRRPTYMDPAILDPWGGPPPHPTAADPTVPTHPPLLAAP